MTPPPDVDRALKIVLDPDRAEADRVAWLSRLRGRKDVGVLRALVPVLNEPLEWLGREVAHLVGISTGRDDVLVGVDTRGLLAASTEPRDALIMDDVGIAHSATLGDLVRVDDVPALAHRLAGVPPWTATGPHTRAWFRRLDRPALVRGSGRFCLGLTATDAVRVVTRREEPGMLRVALLHGRAHIKTPRDAEAEALAVEVNGVRGAGACGVGGRVTLRGRVVLELVSFAPAAAGPHPPGWSPGLVHRALDDAGHAIELPQGWRGLVSYREPLARAVPPGEAATVGALRLDAHGRLEVDA